MTKPTCPNCKTVDHGAMLPSDHGGQFLFTRCGHCNHGYSYNAKGEVQTGHREQEPSNGLMPPRELLHQGHVYIRRDIALRHEQSAHEPCALPAEAREVIEAFLQQGDFGSPHWLGDKARALLAGTAPPIAAEKQRVYDHSQMSDAEIERRYGDSDEEQDPASTPEGPGDPGFTEMLERIRDEVGVEIFDMQHPQTWARAVKAAGAAQPPGESRDTERLNFVLREQAFIVAEYGLGKVYQLQSQDEDENYHVLSGSESTYFTTERDAIDAAIERATATKEVR